MASSFDFNGAVAEVCRRTLTYGLKTIAAQTVEALHAFVSRKDTFVAFYCVSIIYLTQKHP